MKLIDSMLYELWYIFCAEGGPFYDIDKRNSMSRVIQQTCTPEEFVAMVDLLSEIPTTFEHNGQTINFKEKEHELKYGLSQEFLGYIYEKRFLGNQFVNEYLNTTLRRSSDNTYLIDLIGCTSNLGLVNTLICILNKKNEQRVLNSIRTVIELHYDTYGLQNETLVDKMLEQNRQSVLYPFLVESVHADKDAVQKGILHTK